MNLAYSNKSERYMSSLRKDILPLLPNKMMRVMEVGCGTGATLNYLKQSGKSDWICGVELSRDAYEQARETLDLAINGNIETIDLPLEKESLDLILCLDVVEHLVDPCIVDPKIWTV
jgi:cyclopropane fatty-acyl-phospholipid synthase-like methyltransferase